ncbi:MAG: Ferrous iron transport peroxidase EfeB, partial [uncultured Rubrobacteraceae bacterium]
GRSDGDLCVQACADDPQVAFHAVRNLVRISRGLAVVRWSQLGFGRTASTSKTQATPRNLMGVKDGTNNIKAEDEDLMNRHVWVPDEDGPSWMVGGTYLVARRIRMLIEVWDRVSLGEQEASIGRHKYSGAPIGKGDEFDPVDLKATDESGEPLIAPDAHVRLARQSDEEKILRRGYSFTDGFDAERGQLDAGLFFISFQRDPHKQFVPLQQRLAANDRLNEYIRHTSSALFACPPGATKGEFVGERLLAT